MPGRKVDSFSPYTGSLTVRLPMLLLGEVYLASVQRKRDVSDIVYSALAAWIEQANEQEGPGPSAAPGFAQSKKAGRPKANAEARRAAP